MTITALGRKAHDKEELNQTMERVAEFQGDFLHFADAVYSEAVLERETHAGEASGRRTRPRTRAAKPLETMATAAMNSVASSARRAVWGSLLTADLNSRYWNEMASRFSWRDKAAKIFLAATASSAVASWGVWEDVEQLWQALSGLSAILAIALPIVDWSKESRFMTELATKWKSLQSSYELAWVDLEDGILADSEVRQMLRRLREVEDSIGSGESPKPVDKKLVAEVQTDVLKSRGLNQTSIKRN